MVLQGRVLYCANVHKSMKVISNPQRNTASWSAVWAPDAEAAPALRNVMAQLPKGQPEKFSDEVAKAQGAMGEEGAAAPAQ